MIPTRMAPRLLARLDNELTTGSCGWCKRALPANGPSLDFCPPALGGEGSACQWNWHQARATGTAEINAMPNTPAWMRELIG